MSELRATATIMVLEAGVYCAFMAPGSPAVDASTGLPGVRLSVGPGQRTGHVSIAGFEDQGWLAGRDDAALIRVTGGPAQVLVTVYQGSEGVAPKVQVLRLGDPAAVDATGAAPVEAMAHVYGRGDVGGRFGDWIGERGSRRWIEGFALHPVRLTPPGEMEYQAVLGRGWLSPWIEAGQFCGSRGMSLPILGLHVRLRGKAAEAFDVAVSASFVDGTSAGPVSAGPLEAASLAALEAFQVALLPKEKAEAPAGKRRR